jgi:hypothetical protein
MRTFAFSVKERGAVNRRLYWDSNQIAAASFSLLAYVRTTKE